MLHSRILSLASAAALIALLAVQPAYAGRSTQIQDPVDNTGPCQLGSPTCLFSVDISSSGIFSSAYIYEEGIVSIDALLPTNWDPANPSTFGSGIWFTPGYSPGTTYQVNAYFVAGFDDTPDAWGFNFFTQGSPLVDEFGSALAPQMQVFLSSGTGLFANPATQSGGWDGASAVLGYLPGFAPPAGAYIGFSWGTGATQLVRNGNGLLVGSQITDTDFVSTAGIGGTSPPTQFTPLYANGTGSVPEPATWAMMLLGFGSIGLVLRRRARAPASIA